MRSAAGLILLLAVSPALRADPVSVAPVADSASASGSRDSLSTKTPRDTAAKAYSRADSAVIVKRQFNHREQIITGSVVMACIAGVLVVMNNYNPR